jgi:zinc protease
LARKYAGSFSVTIQTKDSSAKDAIDLANKELERMQREPVSETELEGAKKFLIGNFPLKYSGTQEDFTKFAAQIEFYGLGMDYPEKYPSLIGAVTARDILRVAKEYLKPDKNILVVVGDLEKAQMQ